MSERPLLNLRENLLLLLLLLLFQLNTGAVLLSCQLQVLLRLELARCLSSEQCDMDQMVEEVSSSFFVDTNIFCPHSNQPLDLIRWPTC